MYLVPRQCLLKPRRDHTGFAQPPRRVHQTPRHQILELKLVVLMNLWVQVHFQFKHVLSVELQLGLGGGVAGTAQRGEIDVHRDDHRLIVAVVGQVVEGFRFRHCCH